MTHGDDEIDDPVAAPEPAGGLARSPVTGGGGGGIEPYRGGGGGEIVDAEVVSDRPAGGNELRRLHQIMRGRYRYAAALAGAGLAAGAWLGYRAGHLVFASVGQVRVMTVVPKLLYSTDEKGPMAGFEGYVDTQVAMLKSQAVVEKAMESPDYQRLGRGASDASVLAYLGSVAVTREGEIIQVQSVDRDRDAAVVETRALIAAYMHLAQGANRATGDLKIERLTALQVTWGNELAALRKRIMDIAGENKQTDLKAAIAFKQQQVNHWDEAIADRKLQLAEAERVLAAARGGAGKPPPDWSAEQWRRFSPALSATLDDRDAAQHLIDTLTAGGAMANDATVRRARAVIDADDRKAREKVADLRDDWTAGRLQLAPDPAGRGGLPADPDALRAEIASIEQMRAATAAELKAYGDQQMHIDDLQAQLTQAQQDRAGAEREIVKENVESDGNQRVQVISFGDRPLGPYRDTRVPFAAAGGGGGALLGFAVVLGLAALDRRVRSPDEAGPPSAGAGTMLGLLPQLPDDLSDPAAAAAAAHCVHEVRTAMQLWARHAKHRVFTVTSPAAAAGKTSLTLALGLSFAAAKRRTLIVDCDLVGAGLTARLDQIVTRRLGQVLVGAGRLTADQLAAALAEGRRTGRRLGDVLVEAGTVDRAAVDAAVDDQVRHPLGVVDAAHGTPLDQCVAETAVPNLHVLPVGSATVRDVPLLSPEAMQELVEAAGRAYDIVLIDTGPILGSLEAQVAVAVADGVVMTVTKGSSRPLVARAMTQVSTVGGRLAGVVFNRASVGDLLIYTGGSSRARSVPAAANLVPPPATGTTGPTAKLGPLAAAVARVAPGARRPTGGS